MPLQPANIYEYEVDVAPNEIDEMGHVNNAVYLNWVQAAVLKHWRRLAPKEVAAAHLWVALKHEISYLRPAFPGDHIVVKVVLQKLQGARAFYKTIINHGDDVLVEVESCWCCLDSATRKPVRLARDIVARFLPADVPHHG
nr:thioesterase family protein [uncultured Rhodopila sp.]